ncbi:MAG: methyltransferase [Tabrizicola sp.]|nr:methyltransferase [Tabrizicola sp.]
MRFARLTLALETGALLLPTEGRIAIYRPRAEDDLSPLPLDRVVALTGFRPDHDHFAALGVSVEHGPPYAAALVCLPRAKAEARALIARAAGEVIPGGVIAVDGQKTDGVDSVLRDLRARVPLSEALSKAHGKLATFAAGPDLSDWMARPTLVDGGFQTLPGVFSADGPDRGSVLLADALPARLGPKVVDLGAGWGYLSRAVLARDGVKRLDLVEAEAEALDCARVNITDPRARFHWADATTFRPENLVETVVCNPPFHQGREADPALGAAFIAAARRMLAPDGALWLVANRHLPYDTVLSGHFLDVVNIGGDTAFRVIRAAKPRRA